ncbi:hypothetical protein DRO37_08580 [Candidatus Bathyarchaeota archaeon]|nr:MAG: hypothetical protein DRO37_08580 [Candidatus Bathyarchaeota archaeon]
MRPEVLAAVFIGGCLYAFTALSKNMLEGERFDPRKLSKTIFLAGLLAVLNTVMGVGEFSEIDLVIQGAGETVLLDKLLKLLRALMAGMDEPRW